MLYPTELLARTSALYKKNWQVSTENWQVSTENWLGGKLLVLFCLLWHILLRMQKQKGGSPYAGNQ